MDEVLPDGYLIGLSLVLVAIAWFSLRGTEGRTTGEGLVLLVGLVTVLVWAVLRQPSCF